MAHVDSLSESFCQCIAPMSLSNAKFSCSLNSPIFSDIQLVGLFVIVHHLLLLLGFVNLIPSLNSSKSRMYLTYVVY